MPRLARSARPARWLLALRAALVALVALADHADEEPAVLFERCRRSRRPAVYSAVYSLPPEHIHNCASITTTELLASNIEVSSISTLSGSDSSDTVLLTQRRGPVHQLDVVSEGDRNRWDLLRDPSGETRLGPSRSFRDHSCRNSNMFCDASILWPEPSGFLLVDRHRVLQFSFTWQPEGTEVVVGSLGQFYALGLGDSPDGASTELLSYPTSAAVYRPYNATQIAHNFPLTPLFPHAHLRLVFVTDTGNHRVLMLNASTEGQLEPLGEFGVRGEARANQSGLDSPHGIAVWAPASESRFEPTFANVFVADRRNNRLVKLNVGYPWESSSEGRRRNLSRPSLFYGGHYGADSLGVASNETLLDPVGVAVFRHYVMVAEALGNAITVLAVHHSVFDRLYFVTRLMPVLGVQLTGHFSVTGQGYVWYTYVNLPQEYAIGSFYLDETLRESPPHDDVEFFINTCANQSYYDSLLLDEAVYLEAVGYFLNVSGINWLFPRFPGYFDIFSFNVTAQGVMFFNLNLPQFGPDLNTTILRGRMTICEEVADTSGSLATMTSALSSRVAFLSDAAPAAGAGACLAAAAAVALRVVL